jgi:hypothetical protein
MYSNIEHINTACNKRLYGISNTERSKRMCRILKHNAAEFIGEWLHRHAKLSVDA